MRLYQKVVGVWTDGTRAIAVTGDGTVAAFRIADASFERASRVRLGEQVKHAIFAPDGTAILAGIGGSVATEADGTPPVVVAHHREQVRCLAISPDGKSIASGSDDGTIQVIDRKSGRRVRLLGHRERVRHVAFTPDGKTLLSSDGDGIIRRWNLAAIPSTVLPAGASAPASGASEGAAQALAVSPDGLHVAAIDSAGAVITWNVADGGVQHLGDLRDHVTALAFTEASVVTGTTEGTVNFWIADTPGIRRGFDGQITQIAVSRDGGRVAIATSKGPVQLYSPRGTALGQITGNTGGTDALAFDATGDLLATGGQDRVIRVWNVHDPAAPAELAQLEGPRGDTHHVAFSPDGTLLVSAGNDGAVRAWAVKDGAVDPKHGHMLVEHTGAVSAIAFDASGRWLVSAGRDHGVSRTPLAGGPARTVQLASPAIALVVSADGTVHAVTTSGTVARWTMTEAPVETDTGVQAAVPLAGDRWAVALGDGSVAATSLVPRALDLAALVSTAPGTK